MKMLMSDLLKGELLDGVVLYRLIAACVHYGE